MDLMERIVSDQDFLMGKPRVKGTRISVAFILYLLAGGNNAGDIVKHYPHLTVDDIRACCLYAIENLPGGKPDWKFEGSFLDSDEWALVEGDETQTLESLFRNG